MLDVWGAEHTYLRHRLPTDKSRIIDNRAYNKTARSAFARFSVRVCNVQQNHWPRSFVCPHTNIQFYKRAYNIPCKDVMKTNQHRQVRYRIALLLVLLCFGLIGLQSCSDITHSPMPEKVGLSDLGTTSSIIARSVANILKDEQTANFLHQQCMKKFDGATNVLWHTLEQTMPTHQSLSWNQLVASNDETKSLGNGSKVAEIVSAIETHFDKRRLHLYWINAKQWDGKEKPTVVFAPLDEDLDKVTTVSGFTGFGEDGIVSVNAKYAEKHPVVVIVYNERTDYDSIHAAE